MKANRLGWLWLVILALYLQCLCPAVSAIGCFVCTSINGSEPFCEDPFNTTYPDPSIDFYQSECQAGRKHREGLFPASVCVKMKGTFSDTSETLLIRTCALDSNSLTMDTEIARIPHTCSHFDFVSDARPGVRSDSPSRRVFGCIDVCDSVDGCNGSSKMTTNLVFSLPFVTICLLFWL